MVLGISGALAVVTPVFSAPLPASQSQDRIEEAWQTAGPRRALFANVAGAAVAGDGSIIIADSNGQTIYRYEPSTGRFAVFAGTGQGPSEVATPTLVAITPGGDAAVYDVGRRAVLFYDISEPGSLRPKTHVLMDERITNPKGFTFLSDGTFVVAGGRMAMLRGEGPVHAVHHFDAGGELLASAFAVPDFEDRAALIQSIGGPITALADGGLLYSNSAPHRILRFDRDLEPTVIAADEDMIGPIIDEFAVSVELPGGREGKGYRWFFDQSKAVFEVADGRILNIITRKYREDSVWEWWNENGTLDERFTVPRAYHPLARVPNGEIVAFYESPRTGNHIVAGLRIR